MKNNLLRSARWLALALAGLTAACASRQTPDVTVYEDGTYRGVYIDRERVEVALELRLQNGMVTAASFRHLGYGDGFRLRTAEEPQRSIVQQYQEALDYLVGKNLEAHLSELYRPERIITTEVDGYTQATVRANKVLSAIRDALNRGVYSH